VYKKSFTLSILLTFFLSFGASIGAASERYTLPSGEVLQDPTKPYGVQKKKVRAKAKRPKLSLNYIMSAGENRRAMINGKKVYEGDSVSGARVRSITSEYVSLVYGGEVFRLYLNKVKNIRK
jgi:hypothetical protein